MAGIPADDAEAVLKKLEESGVFDQLRRQLASQITSNAQLQKEVEAAVVQSKHLPKPTSDKRTLAAAREQIRRELTGKTLGLMLARVWEEMDQEGSPLVERMQREMHLALCKIREQREEQ